MGRRKPNKGAKRKRKQEKRRRPRRTLRPWPAVKRVDEAKLKAMIDRAGEGALSEEERAELRAVVETLSFVVRELGEKNLTIRRLRSLFGLTSSEKLNKLLSAATDGGADRGPEEAEDSETREGDVASEQEEQPAKGHGRNGADAYTGADRIQVPHERLCPGDSCPSCARGKVYEQKHRPRLLVRVEGQAPVKATVYELQTFRCNLCGELFVAKLPEGAGDEKYDASAKGIVALLKYGSGLPFNRLERLEGHLGVPLPASTQWDLVRDAAYDVTPVYEE
ncbi:MAG: hypothetical protein D6688_13100, partial [Alphaproteobacteria bacterium]